MAYIDKNIRRVLDIIDENAKDGQKASQRLDDIFYSIQNTTNPVTLKRFIKSAQENADYIIISIKMINDHFTSYRRYLDEKSKSGQL